MLNNFVVRDNSRERFATLEFNKTSLKLLKYILRRELCRRADGLPLASRRLPVTYE